VTQAYAYIDAQKADPECQCTTEQMCTWMDVSRSGFYEWRHREPSATARRRDDLKTLIAWAFEDSDGTYGHRRIAAQLARWGHPAGPELVRDLMRDLGLVPCQPRPWRDGLTDGDPSSTLPDLLGQDFTAPAPGTKLVGDITYIPTWEGWLYLATVIDCHTKAVIGWAVADHYKTSLIEAAIRSAAATHDLAGAIFHSDRGSNYTSRAYAKVLDEIGIKQSVGRTGICYDNAMAESFFAALKNERVNRTVYPTRVHAHRDIARYIETWYNINRLHSALGYKTPREAHNAYHTQHTIA
jgi:putative transposase